MPSLLLLRWLNIVLRAISGNSRDGSVFQIRKHMAAEKAMVHRRTFLKIYSLSLKINEFENKID